MEKLISIITPVYNHEKFIGATIDSILSQTYQNWELLIVDDQSTDRSWEIIQECAKKDSRIRVFRNETNRGLIENWKFLIDNSKGEYIAFLEGDDVFYEENLNEKMKIFKQFSDVGMVYCGFSIIDENDRVLVGDFYKKMGTRTYKDQIIRPVEYLRSKISLLSTYSQIMIKREALMISGYPRSFAPNEKVFLPSDWDFNFRISTRNKVYFIDDILLRYRKHPSSSSAATLKVSEQLSMILDEYGREFSEDEEVLKAIEYMRGKTHYFKIVFYVENGLKKEAWREFFLYVKRFPSNLFSDIILNTFLLGRLIIPSGLSRYLKRLYLNN